MTFVARNIDELLDQLALWNNALLLSHATGEARLALLSSMDLGAALLARLIVRPVGILRPALQLIRYRETADVAHVIERLDRALRDAS